jgi:1-acyl-sn-glycerol-3-phosphate acyltransferase
VTAADPLWRPRSSCGPHCLPEPGQIGLASAATRARRLAALAGVLLLGALLLPVLPVLGPRGRHVVARTWARAVLRALGIRLVARGRMPQRRALLTANHISWMDVVAILAVAPARLVAKHEVRCWPLIGTLAVAAGTIFVDRTRPRRLPQTVADTAAALRQGGVVAVFPEGTTWCGVRAGGCAALGRFRPAIFQAAIDARAAVVPLTLGYYAGPGREGTTAAAFLGDETLWASLRRVLAVRDLTITITAAPAVHPDASATRRALARIAESAVRIAPRPVAARAAYPVLGEPRSSLVALARPEPADPARVDRPSTDPARADRPSTDPARRERPSADPARRERPSADPARRERPSGDPEVLGLAA